MTAAEVKRDLPRVKVKTGRRTYWARLSGRVNPRATVTLSYVEHGAPRHHLRGAAWADWHFTWEQIAEAITNGKAIQLD